MPHLRFIVGRAICSLLVVVLAACKSALPEAGTRIPPVLPSQARSIDVLLASPYCQAQGCVEGKSSLSLWRGYVIPVLRSSPSAPFPTKLIVWIDQQQIVEVTFYTPWDDRIVASGSVLHFLEVFLPRNEAKRIHQDLYRSLQPDMKFNRTATGYTIVAGTTIHSGDGHLDEQKQDLVIGLELDNDARVQFLGQMMKSYFVEDSQGIRPLPYYAPCGCPSIDLNSDAAGEFLVRGHLETGALLSDKKGHLVTFAVDLQRYRSDRTDLLSKEHPEWVQGTTLRFPVGVSQSGTIVSTAVITPLSLPKLQQALQSGEEFDLSGIFASCSGVPPMPRPVYFSNACYLQY